MLTDLTNELLVIAGIRASMEQLLSLSSRYNESGEAQTAIHVQDLDAPSAPGEFTALAEKRTHLVQEYATIRYEILGQMSAYDTFCAQHKIVSSDNWDRLLVELRPYLSDIKLPAIT